MADRTLAEEIAELREVLRHARADVARLTAEVERLRAGAGRIVCSVHGEQPVLCQGCAWDVERENERLRAGVEEIAALTCNCTPYADGSHATDCNRRHVAVEMAVELGRL